MPFLFLANISINQFLIPGVYSPQCNINNIEAIWPNGPINQSILNQSINFVDQLCLSFSGKQIRVGILYLWKFLECNYWTLSYKINSPFCFFTTTFSWLMIIMSTTVNICHSHISPLAKFHYRRKQLNNTQMEISSIWAYTINWSNKITDSGI